MEFEMVRIGYFWYLPEHDKVHWFLGDVVVFIQIVLHYQSQLIHIFNFHIWFVIVLWIHKIAEHETAKIIFSDDTFLFTLESFEQFVKVSVKLFLGDFFHAFDEPLSVGVVHQTVVVNPHDFVHPHSCEGVGFSDASG